MIRLQQILLSLVLVVAAPLSHAQSPSSRGVVYDTGADHFEAKCAFCHGAKGEGVGIFPALKGLSAQEAQNKLERYRSSKKVGRYSALMYVRSSQLTDKQIEQLADYIGQLPR